MGRAAAAVKTHNLTLSWALGQLSRQLGAGCDLGGEGGAKLTRSVAQHPTGSDGSLQGCMVRRHGGLRGGGCSNQAASTLCRVSTRWAAGRGTSRASGPAQAPGPGAAEPSWRRRAGRLACAPAGLSPRAATGHGCASNLGRALPLGSQPALRLVASFILSLALL